jgi:hypothetical protein
MGYTITGLVIEMPGRFLEVTCVTTKLRSVERTRDGEIKKKY